jgi:glycosyltransferase involved in cell wall biosynthesis
MDSIVSVIIPTFNGVKYIRETLESVLHQSYAALEVIVVDDGSSDATAQAVSAYAPRVTLIRQANSGHPAARNRGVSSATGEFLSFLDHDDVWEPAKIERQMQCFRQDPALDLVFGHICNFFTPEMTGQERLRVSVPLDPLPGLLQGAMLAKRISFERVGPFCEERDMGDFLDWYGRAMILGMRTEMLPETVLHRRIHATNYNRTHGHLRQQYLPALKQLLDRRRAAKAKAAQSEGKI